MRLKIFPILFITMLVINTSFAQLCQGSLGDPIINITFGHGANPGAPLTAATTTYQYVSTDCPGDGYYAVRNSTNSCFGNSWHSFSSDHTGDPGGYFMLVNASVQPGAFYLDTVRGLCGNSTYEFAAWIMNVIIPSACSGNSILPNLTFSIERTDGTVLQTSNSGSISTESTATWKPFGFFFTTPVGVSDVVVRMVNNAPGGCGNDLALDDITFRPCGPLLTPSITGMSSNTVSLCEGTAGSFTFNCTVSGGFNTPVFQWQQRINGGSWTDIAGETTTTLNRSFNTATPAGIYEYRLAVAEMGNIGSAQCRIVSQPITVKVNSRPATTATNNGAVCTGSTATLTATGGTQYTWTGPNSYSASGALVQVSNIQPNQAGKYYVVVTNAAGCVNTDSTVVTVNPSPTATIIFSNAAVCIGDSIQLTGSGGPGYNWIPVAGLSNPAIPDPKASPAITTLYKLVVTNSFSCTDTATVNIEVIPETIVNAGPDKIMLEGQRIQLAGSVTGQGISYSWSPPTYIDDVNALQPIVNPPADARYILTAVSTYGCKTVMDTMYLKVYKAIFIPNAFTPNGDGINDTWNIPALASYPNFELFIYNRFGELVFRTKNTPVAWDGTYKGKDCVAGAYSYLIKTGNRDEIINGTVLLVR